MSLWTLFLVAANVGLIYLLVAAPMGRRTVRQRLVLAAPREAVRDALHPLGRDSGWSGEIVEAYDEGGETVRVRLSWEGRDGRPIERLLRVMPAADGLGFSTRIVEDSSLDAAFWSNFEEAVSIGGRDGAVELEIVQTDRYRGAAFWAFRHFRLRREARRLRQWLATGSFRRTAIFEHPLTQAGFALVSALILWPLFGLTLQGFVLAACLTTVVALHELGHMAAFRLMGHRTARMIFIPLLGGIAIGARPYDRRFEVAFVALMGAGFSAFLVPLGIAASGYFASGRLFYFAGIAGVLAGFLALFNLANLFPVWRFDGGQVLRQLGLGPIGLGLSSSALLLVFAGVGVMAGAPPAMMVAAGAVFAILSLVTSGNAARPRQALHPMSRPETVLIAAGLVAVIAVHACGVIWAADRYRDVGRSIAERHALAPGIGAAFQP